jgi:hypothetical protein
MSWNALLAANGAAQTTATAGANPWLGSPFRWLKGLANLPRGTAAREILETMVRGFGYRTQRARVAQSFAVKSHVVKVKLSMGWGGANNFKFQQIEDDPYTHLAMLALAPGDAWLWVCPKAVAWANASGQHRADSRWVELATGNVPGWLQSHGGHIAGAQALCTAEFGSPP